MEEQRRSIDAAEGSKHGFPSEVILGQDLARPVVIGRRRKLVLICGPCVIESRDKCLSMAEDIVKIASQLKIGLVFKSSYDKANRTSLQSFRGLGMGEGLKILGEVRTQFGVPVVTDAHSIDEIRAVAEVVDMVQIPAFLCRQTDLLVAAGETGKAVLVKKGQFLPPDDMFFVAQKVVSTGNNQVMVAERGACFGYRDLVVDFRSLDKMRKMGLLTVFDATHSVQSMGGAQGRSSGNREYVACLARAAAAVGVDALFIEAHSNPDESPSDGPNMLPIDGLLALMKEVLAISELVSGPGVFSVEEQRGYKNTKSVS